MIRAASVLLILISLASTPAAAQTPASDPPMAPLGARFTVSALGNLPTGSSIYSLLDTTMPEIISDRIDDGGLLAGQAPRIGARGSSWTQTTFRVGDIDITDPDGSGTPMLIPGLFMWERVDVATGVMPIDLNAPGVAVTLVPRRPSATWMHTLELFAAPPIFMSRTTTTTPPAIARQDSWGNGTLFVSGPLIPNRLGILATGTWTNSSYFERADPTSLTSNHASAFAHLVYTPNEQDELRFIGWGNIATAPQANRLAFGQPLSSEKDTSLHGQAVWEHRTASGTSWAAFGGVTARNRDSDLRASSPITIERLTGGPVPQLLAPGTGTDATWSLGARVNPARLQLGDSTHTMSAGASVSGASTNTRATFSGRVGELVDGVPARIWDFSSPVAASERSSHVVAAYADDSVRLTPRLTVSAGVRFESVTGSAAGSTGSISWNNWYPRGSLRVQLFGPIAAIAAFSRSGYELPLQDLAYGDPNAPVGSVYRWNATGADPTLRQVGPLVARVGPGTGGSASFSRIDPSLQRPRMDEVVFGFDARPRPGTMYRLLAIARREQQLIGAVDVGVPESSYAVLIVPDPIADKDSQGVVKVLNRSTATFGADQYLLTNPSDHEATFVGIELYAQSSYKNFFYTFGGTAGRSEGLAADIGFTSAENDQGVLGSVFINPNARTNAQGRLFTERGYTIKTSGAYQLPGDVTLGVAARYQDGQHFARLLTVTGLNQGAEVVRTYRNGRTRFTYTLTLDARLQKAFTAGPNRVTLMADAYNLLNTGTEIEEISVTGPDSRVTSAVQPPRSFRVGLRFSF
ncbi:MAG: TonB-dependent receptor [Acidobacteriota bacterium]